MELILAMAPQGEGGGGSMISTLIMFGAIFAIFYLVDLNNKSWIPKAALKKDS